MAKYTVELKDLVDNETIDIGLKNYPLYTPKLFNPTEYGKDYKGVPFTDFRHYLNNRLIRHYYFREIGFETGALFVFKLNNAIEEIMPYYNQLLKSADTEFNPLWNVEMHETFSHSVTDAGNQTTNTTGNGTITTDTTENGNSTTNENLEQISDNDNINNLTRTPNIKNETTNAEMDTPEINMTEAEIKAHSYLSKANHSINEESGNETTNTTISENGKVTNDNSINSESENTVNSSQSSNNTSDIIVDNTNNRTETYTRLTEGSSAGLPYSDAIKQWRRIMLNIEIMIVEDRKIKDCFMQIY